MDSYAIQTVVQENGETITTIVDTPIEVTSVNGMTGDVQVEPKIEGFQANHYYTAGTAITYNNEIYYARVDFTSGSSFNAGDWNASPVESLTNNLVYAPNAGHEQSTFTTTGTGTTVLQTVTIEKDGIYFAFCDGWLNQNSVNISGNKYLNVGFTKNNNFLHNTQNQVYDDHGADTTKQFDMDTMMVIRASAGDVIRLTMFDAQVSGLIYTYSWGVIRVSDTSN